MDRALVMEARVEGGDGFWQQTSIWLQALRPFSLPLSAVPVLLGTLLAVYDGWFAPGPFLLTLLGTVAIHTGANLANNYYDYVRGLDGSDSFGPARLISQGHVGPGAMRNAMGLAFAVGIVSGLALAIQVGWPILAIGLVCVAVAYFYSADPRPMAYMGLGEILVFIFLGGVIVEGSYYVQALQLSEAGLWVSAILGLWATCVLVLNDIRDRGRDRRAGKLTIAAVVGRQWSEKEFAALAFGSYGLVVAGVMVGKLPAAALATFLTLPWAARLVHSLRTGLEGWALTRLQGTTARHYAAFSALLAAGIAVGGHS